MAILNFISAHAMVIGAIALYALSGLVATMPPKGSDFSKFATWYGWFYDYAHILVNSRGEKVIAAPPTDGGNAMKLAVLVFASAIALASVTAHGQSTITTPPEAPTPQAPIFTPASQAVYLSLNKTSAVGNLTTETLNITSTCGIEGAELLVPGVSMTGYMGGVACTPDLSAILSKTLIPANAFSFSGAADGGWSLNSTSAKHSIFQVRGSITYNIGSSGVIAPISFGWVKAPGFGAGSNGFLFSVGIGKVFGVSQ